MESLTYDSEFISKFLMQSITLCRKIDISQLLYKYIFKRFIRGEKFVLTA